MPSIFRTTWATVGLVAVIAFLGLKVIRGYDEYHQEQQRAKDAQAKLGLTEQEHARLQARLDQAGDKDYLERQARLKLNYQFPDERVVFIEDGAVATTIASASASAEKMGALARFRAWLYAVLDDATGKPK